MNIYPNFDYSVAKFKNGNRVIIQGQISTYIRKKFNGIYYLCRLVLRYEQPILELRRRGIPKKAYDSWIMNLLLDTLIKESYKLLKFGKLNPELRDLNGTIMGFVKDPDQRTELERLIG